jgi:hypothetical protein
LALLISFLTAASERSSSGLSGGVSGPSFFGTSSCFGVAFKAVFAGSSRSIACSLPPRRFVTRATHVGRKLDLVHLNHFDILVGKSTLQSSMMIRLLRLNAAHAALENLASFE